MRSHLLMCLALLAAPALRADDGLPPVSDVRWDQLKEHVGALLRGLDAAKAPLKEGADVKAVLDDPGKDLDAACVKVQRLLDAHCLAAIHINPESRVKATRGPAPAELVNDKARVVLVRVQNEAGITQALRVGGDGVRSEGNKAGWLRAAVIAPAPLGKSLSGQRLEYVLLELHPGESGKREATLRFDAGQGTQDLGFRAEVAILFKVR